MADNITLDAGSGGATLAAASLSISGDTAIVQMVGCGILSGSEGAWTHSQMVGGAGAVAAGVQRVTLASDDPAVTDLAAIEVLLGTIDTDTGAMVTDLAAIEVLLTAANVDHAANEALLTTIDADTGGILTAVQIMDDWDESDRAKVNLIVGQAGIAAGAGAVGVTVPRVTLASDDPAVVDLAAIEVLLTGMDADTDAIKTAVQGTLTVGSHAVTNAGTFVVQIDGAALTALQDTKTNTDALGNSLVQSDQAFGQGVTLLQMVGAIRDDSLTTLAEIEGDAIPLRVNSTGALHVTGAGGGTQYQIDDAGGATDTGTLALAIRDDALTTLTPVDGDYVGLRVSSTGALHVTGGGGGTEYTEDSATPGTITGTATVMERDDALGTLTPIEGDWAAMRCTAEGALWVQDFNSDAILADTAAMVVDLAAIETLLGTIDTDTGNIATSTSTIAGAVSGTEMQVDVVAALPAGTNAIGKLAANSGVDIGDVDVTSIAAGTNTIGGVIAHQQTDSAYDGTTACTIKRFHVVTSTSDTSIITAVAGKKFRILSLSIIALSATATNVHFETKTTNTDCFGDSTSPIPVAIDADGDNHGGVVMNFNPGGWFETADANEDMAIILSAAQPVLICGNYIEVA